MANKKTNSSVDAKQTINHVQTRRVYTGASSRPIAIDHVTGRNNRHLDLETKELRSVALELNERLPAGCHDWHIIDVIAVIKC